MLVEDCFFLGHITKIHGLQGAVVAALDTDQPEKYLQMESIFVERHGELVPFFIEKVDLTSRGHFIICFENMDPAEAERLVGSALYLPLSMLAPLNGPKQFYYHQIIGYAVHDQQGELLGTCSGVNDHTAQHLLIIDRPGGQEMLVPLVDEFLQRVDHEARRLDLHLPEGLKELYE